MRTNWEYIARYMTEVSELVAQQTEELYKAGEPKTTPNLVGPIIKITFEEEKKPGNKKDKMRLYSGAFFMET